jgi:hypothetical protein
VAVAETDDDGKKIDPTLRDPVAEQLRSIPEVSRRLVLPVKPEEAEWLLRPKGAEVHLVRREGMKYPLTPIAQSKLGTDLSLRLRTVARAEALKRLTTPLPSPQSVREGRSLNFDVELLKYAGPAGEGQVVPWSQETVALSVKDEIALRFTNRGRRAADITVLHIDPDYGISAWLPPAPFVFGNRLLPPELIQREEKALYTDHATVAADAMRVHYFVVMAVKGEGSPSDFTGLASDSLADARRGMRSALLESDIGLLLESLYDQSVRDKAAARQRGDIGKGLDRKTLEDYLVRIYRWEVPAQQ